MFELDHIAFAVADLESTRAELRALGLTTTAVGVCRWTARGRSHRARAISVVFAAGYLDLVESAGAAWPEHLRASPLFRRGIAPSGVVLASELLEESRVALSARGLAVGAPYEIDRELPGACGDQRHFFRRAGHAHADDERGEYFRRFLVAESRIDSGAPVRSGLLRTCTAREFGAGDPARTGVQLQRQRLQSDRRKIQGSGVPAGSRLAMHSHESHRHRPVRW